MADINVLNRAIDSIFRQSEADPATRERPKKQKKNRRSFEQELALTVLLVDLATCDENFHPREYEVISRGLARLFGAGPEHVADLVQRAKAVLGNLRGTTQFAELLRSSLSEEQKQVVAQLIDDVIAADQVEDGFEIYFRQKYLSLLGIPEKKEKKSVEGKTNN
jgi:uncharacterized tellurite resistance protein B-like protein